MVVLALASGCSAEEKFCTLALAFAEIDVDVHALPDAQQVCVDDECAEVRDGIAELDPPLIDEGTTDVDIVIVDEAGTTLVTAEDVRLPRAYPNGFDCDGDAPSGIVTVLADGSVSTTRDVDGSTSDDGG